MLPLITFQIYFLLSLDINEGLNLVICQISRLNCQLFQLVFYRVQMRSERNSEFSSKEEATFDNRYPIFDCWAWIWCPQERDALLTRSNSNTEYQPLRNVCSRRPSREFSVIFSFTYVTILLEVTSRLSLSFFLFLYLIRAASNILLNKNL